MNNIEFENLRNKFIEDNIDLINNNNWGILIYKIQNIFKDSEWAQTQMYKTFLDCDINILDHLIHIPKSFFEYRYDIESFTIPNHIIELDNSCFANCANLKQLYIPLSLKAIYFNVFWGCPSLTDIYYPGKYSDFEKIKLSDAYSSPIHNQNKIVTLHYGKNFQKTKVFEKIDNIYNNDEDLELPF